MEPTEIVVGIDDSPSAAAALSWAADFARASGLNLRAVHVLDWPVARELYAYSVVDDEVFTDPTVVDEEMRGPIDALFESCHPEPSWTLQYAKGHAGRILVHESKDSALLVVGCREHVGLGRLLTGSASHYGVNHSNCPVVAVPAGHRSPFRRQVVTATAKVQS